MRFLLHVVVQAVGVVRARLKYGGCAWAVGLKSVRCEDGEEVLLVGVSFQPCTREPCASEG